MRELQWGHILLHVLEDGTIFDVSSVNSNEELPECFDDSGDRFVWIRGNRYYIDFRQVAFRHPDRLELDDGTTLRVAADGYGVDDQGGEWEEVFKGIGDPDPDGNYSRYERVGWRRT